MTAGAASGSYQEVEIDVTIGNNGNTIPSLIVASTPGSAPQTTIIPNSTPPALGTYPILNPTPFSAIRYAVLVEVDNPTPLLLRLTDVNVQVAPWVTGARILLPQNPTSASISAFVGQQYQTLGSTPLTLTATVRFWQTPLDNTPSSGSGSNPNTSVFISDSAGTLVTTTADSTNPQPNGMHVADGYDIINPDQLHQGPYGGFYAPARAVNALASGSTLIAASTWTTVFTYTPLLNGGFWRLLWLETGIDNGVTAIPAGRLFWRVRSGSTVLLTNGVIPRCVGEYQATTKILHFGGAGIKAKAANDVLSVDVFSDAVSAGTAGRGQAGIYDGF